MEHTAEPGGGPSPSGGATGVTWDCWSSKWKARLCHSDKPQHLGSFSEERDAIAAIRAAREAAAAGRLEEHKAELRAAVATRRASGQ